jgi:hypothetical protein
VIDIWDPIRKIRVAATPEEKVRQRWIRAMIGQLGFPKSLIAVEKEIGIAGRRADLICYRAAVEGLEPLLLMECKAEAIDAAAQRQVLGYNDSVGAPFVCLVNATQAKTLWIERGGIASVDFLPSYAQLMEKR